MCGSSATSRRVGFLLVAQVRTTEGLRDRLATEREEDLVRILADLSRESDRLLGQEQLVDTVQELRDAGAEAIGPAETMAKALVIPGGAIDALESAPPRGGHAADEGPA